MGCQEQTNKQIEKVDENNLQSRIKILDDHAVCQAKILNTISEFQHWSDEHLSKIKAAKHRTKWTSADDRPIHSAKYRAGPHPRKYEKHEIDRMLGMDVIEPAQTEWVESFVLANKNEKILRSFVDYCKQNKVTICNSPVILPMEDCIDALGEAPIFSTLDDESG